MLHETPLTGTLHATATEAESEMTFELQRPALLGHDVELLSITSVVSAMQSYIMDSNDLVLQATMNTLTLSFYLCIHSCL